MEMLKDTLPICRGEGLVTAEEEILCWTWKRGNNGEGRARKCEMFEVGTMCGNSR